ncbi:peptidoglycan editing factor PgeF [Arsenicicoccus sp. oral taxon 190]|uniref:peptidoglycan editing factor PgeF n=1 Tax=Arsenicicoccus sp. oral taxon 190 TaxID=1658671 RepID=UPI000679FE1A|nr:peptidoglycan editing factor PgeF [Arsenicicoccus sp. oral taxon 190]AKT51641.1 laccase [Arsenicicoccus sp. oral taxon 190]
MLAHQQQDGTVLRVFTDAYGGRSRPPYAPPGAPGQGLNLGSHVGDDPHAVAANRSLLAARVGVDASRLVFLNQVHGAEVVQVDGPCSGPAGDADGVVTTRPDLALAVLVADCTPVLLADPQAGVVGAAHAGRPGMLAGVVPATVAAMRDLGARDITAHVGPSVCGRCYEVPEQMQQDAAQRVPESAARTWSGTPAIDVATGVVSQLSALGVPVTWVPGCTVEQDRFFSYRRSGATGRFGGVVVRRERGSR